MPGGKFEHAFDVSDVEADIKAEKQQKALEQKATKHPIAELEDLSDEAMEVVGEGEEMKKSLENMVNESNDSLPTLDQNLLQEDSGEEVHEITDDMIAEEEPITLEESEIEEITEEPTIEMTADYESDNEVVAENEQKIATLKSDIAQLNEIIRKNPAAWNTESRRIADKNTEITKLQAANDKIKDSVVDLDAYRKKKANTSTTQGGARKAA